MNIVVVFDLTPQPPAPTQRIPGHDLDPVIRLTPAATTQLDEPDLALLELVRERLHNWRP